MEWFLLWIFALLFCAVIYVLFGFSTRGEWVDVNDELPASIPVSYPVALFDAEFGIMIDMADWLPNSRQWRLSSSGEPVTPYRWYRLPSAPHP